MNLSRHTCARTRDHVRGYRSFKYFGSKVWNCLPPCVKNVNDLSVFKKYLYNWCLTDHAKKLLEQLEL